eukprot:m.208102 g.208102  ORF g.208102 m.208102 type:complete len:445 (+) comp18527_c0_seq9:2541-3875(+)
MATEEQPVDDVASNGQDEVVASEGADSGVRTLEVGGVSASAAAAAAASNEPEGGSNGGGTSQTGEQGSSNGSAAQAEGMGKLFIGGLSWDTTDAALTEYFQNFGPVSDCVVMRDPNTGRPRGFGFVTYEAAESCDAAMAAGPHTLDGRQIELKKAVPRGSEQLRSRGPGPAPERTKKLFVGGLSQDATEEAVRQFFEKDGVIEEVLLMYDRATGRSRGFGFVTFASEDVVDRLCEKRFFTFMERELEVKRAVPKRVDGGGRGPPFGGSPAYHGGRGQRFPGYDDYQGYRRGPPGGYEQGPPRGRYGGPPPRRGYGPRGGYEGGYEQFDDGYGNWDGYGAGRGYEGRGRGGGAGGYGPYGGGHQGYDHAGGRGAGYGAPGPGAYGAGVVDPYAAAAGYDGGYDGYGFGGAGYDGPPGAGLGGHYQQGGNFGPQRGAGAGSAYRPY